MAAGILEVLLVDAQDLREHDFCCCLNCLIPCLNEIDPYVSIQYGNQEQISNVAQGEGRKEVWNEKFRFNVNYGGEEDHINTKLVLNVMNKHRFSPDYLVGKTTIYVKDVLLRGMEDGKVRLGHKIYRVVRLDKRYSGEVTVAVNFIKASDGNKEDFRDVKQRGIFPNQEETVLTDVSCGPAYIPFY